VKGIEGLLAALQSDEKLPAIAILFIGSLGLGHQIA